MARAGNRYCDNCIGALSFPTDKTRFAKRDRERGHRYKTVLRWIASTRCVLAKSRNYGAEWLACWTQAQ